MPSCAIVTCKHRSDTTNFHADGITFHRFPSNPDIKQKWITATGRGPVWWPVKRSTICSVHFKENLFRPLPKSRRLFDEAVPTQKLPHIPTAITSKQDLTSKLTSDAMSGVIMEPSDNLQPVSPMATNSTQMDTAKIKENDKDMEDFVRLDETPRKLKMRIQIDGYKSVIQQKNRKIRTLQKKTYRYRKKIADLKDVLKELKETNLVNSDHVTHLESLGVADLIERHDKKISTNNSPCRPHE